MKAITIHGLDNFLDVQIKKRANESGLSLNKTIKGLLYSALGQKGTQTKNDFESFCGLWNKKDEKEFNKKVSDLNKIDLREWQ